MARLIELGAANILAGRACGELEPGADASLDAAFVLGGLRQCVSTALALSPAPDRLALTRAVWSRIAGALGLAVGGPSHSGDNA
jgi:hypothetical protein